MMTTINGKRHMKDSQSMSKVPKDFDEKRFRYCNNAQAVLAIYAKK
jgi:hypothetical protein